MLFLPKVPEITLEWQLVMENPAKVSNNVRIAQILFFLNTLIWLVFGVISLVRVTDSYPGQAVIAAVIAAMMFGNALCMFIGGLWLGKPGKASFFFALAVLAINIVLTFTDQFGWLDFGTFVVDATIFGLLLAARRYFIHPA